VSRAVVHRIGEMGDTTCGRLLGEVSSASTDATEVTCKVCKARDPLAGISPELQVKMRDPAWRAAFNAPLTPSRALAAGMPPVEVLALMLGRWMKVPAADRQWIAETARRCSFIKPKSARARAEGATADLLEALEAVIAAADVLAQERP
jgi:hypothetical protein